MILIGAIIVAIPIFAVAMEIANLTTAIRERR